MAVTAASPRVAATRAQIMDAALAEFAAFGIRRTSMDGVARRAGVSRATLYLHVASKEELFRGLVEQLHDEHEAGMAAVLDEDGPFEARLLRMLDARFGRFVALAAASPHAAELYDQHSRLCGDVARASQVRSEKLLAKLLRQAVAAGEADLSRANLSPAKVAGVLFDCAHGAKGEDASRATPEAFAERLRLGVAVLVAGLAS